jgi:hypothetical protein
VAVLRNAYIILIRTLEGKRTLQRPVCTWEGIVVTMSLKDTWFYGVVCNYEYPVGGHFSAVIILWSLYK